MAKVKFKVEGMDKLQKSLKKLGEVPQKHVTASARKGMNIVKKEAKVNVPYLSGDLQKGIISVAEKTKVKGKKVYRIVFDRNMNDVFQKPIKNPGSRGSPDPKSTGYYPIAQEYGYFAGDGNFIPGFAFTRNALESKAPAVEKTIIDTMKKKIDAEIAKGGLKK